MTIEEYLSQYKRLREKSESLCERMDAMEEKVSSSRSSWNADRMSRGGGDRGAYETMLIEVADARKAYLQAHRAECEFAKQLRTAVNHLYYWEGRLITQIYINNVFFERDHDPFYIGDILEDMSSDRTKAEYISMAKDHLTEILTAQGVEITA